jgi:hypothetical protein
MFKKCPNMHDNIYSVWGKFNMESLMLLLFLLYINNLSPAHSPYLSYL